MEDLLKLTAFSVCMLVGSYLAGSVPLAFTFAEVSVLANRLTRCPSPPPLGDARGTTVVRVQCVSVLGTFFPHLLRTNFDW